MCSVIFKSSRNASVFQRLYWDCKYSGATFSLRNFYLCYIIWWFDEAPVKVFVMTFSLRFTTYILYFQQDRFFKNLYQTCIETYMECESWISSKNNEIKKKTCNPITALWLMMILYNIVTKWLCFCYTQLYLLVRFGGIGRTNCSYFGKTRPKTHRESKVHRSMQESQRNLRRN